MIFDMIDLIRNNKYIYSYNSIIKKDSIFKPSIKKNINNVYSIGKKESIILGLPMEFLAGKKIVKDMLKE